jgi:hypothetical protein
LAPFALADVDQRSSVMATLAHLENQIASSAALALFPEYLLWSSSYVQKLVLYSKEEEFGSVSAWAVARLTEFIHSVLAQRRKLLTDFAARDVAAEALHKQHLSALDSLIERIPPFLSQSKRLQALIPEFTSSAAFQANDSALEDAGADDFILR